MNTVIDLVDAMVSGDAVKTETSFAAAMAEKLTTKLDAMRQDIAQNMFVSEEETEDELVAEDLEWISEEEYLQLSEEEQEDYVTEEQLDELMGKGSVGAVKDMHMSAAYDGRRTKRADFHATQAQRASHIKSKIDTRAQHGKDAQHYHQYGFDSKHAKAQHAALSADAKKKVAKTSGAEYTGKDKGPGIATKGKTTISNPRTASQKKEDDANRIK